MKIGITERGDAALDTSWTNFKGPKILITKSPSKLIRLAADFSNCIIHCTITGLGGSKLEPNVNEAPVELYAYKQWVKNLGPNRVVLRIDPVIPFKPYLQMALNVYAERLGRVRISFLDMYPHVRERLKGIDSILPQYYSSLHASIEQRHLAHSMMLDAEVCGEPDFPCTGCVSLKDLEALNLPIESKGLSNQRKACMCLAEKTELLSTRGQCAHGCLYCYWR